MSVYVPGRINMCHDKVKRLLCVFALINHSAPTASLWAHQWGQAKGPGTAERPVEQMLARGILCEPV